MLPVVLSPVCTAVVEELLATLDEDLKELEDNSELEEHSELEIVRN